MLLAHRRSHRHPFAQPVANLNGFGPLDELLSKRIGDTLFNDDPAGGRASLAGQPEAGDGDQFRGQIQIRISQHNGRVLAAHFHLRPRHPRRQLLINLVADGVRAGEREGNDFWVGRQFAPHRAALSDDDVQYAVRQSRLGQRLGQFERHCGRLRCRFDDDGVSRNQRRRHLPCRNGDGKIPRRDQTHDSKRLAPRVEQLQRQIVRNGLAAERVAQSSKETKNVDGPLDFAGAFGEGLALLARQQFGQLGLARLEEV